MLEPSAVAEIVPRLLDHFQGRQPSTIAAIEDLVALESPSHDKPRLDLCGSHLRDVFLTAGATVEVIANSSGGNHLRICYDPARRAPIAPALVLGHFDTVWPVGTSAIMKIRRQDDQLFGPGVYDMKASLILLADVIHAFHTLALHPPRPVVALLTSDEEIGSPTSRARIESEARQCAYALVLEAPLADGRLKTARKGVGQFAITAHGRAAHAGVEPEKGVNAAVELAHQILAIAGLADPARGTTLTVGTIEGGSTVNTIPALARARVDLRVESIDEAERVCHALAALEPTLPGARLAVTGGLNRPPMVRTPRSASLFHHAQAIGRELALDLHEGSTGGGSDANFTSAVGTPTLDGLGPLGAGAHAIHEHILVSSLPKRAALLAALLLHLPEP